MRVRSLDAIGADIRQPDDPDQPAAAPAFGDLQNASPGVLPVAL
jgi:hypothetical protein